MCAAALFAVTALVACGSAKPAAITTTSAGGGAGRTDASPTATSTVAPTAPAPADASDMVPVPVEPLQGPFDVVQVVDGDTVRIATGDGRITLRLIGIDTPETVHPSRPVGCFGPEASDEAKRLLRGAQVWIELDPGQGLTDKYDRMLAYVWTSPTDMFNWHMIREGFATEYTYDAAYNHRAAFVAAERVAAGEGRGLWGACQTPGG